MCRHTFRRHAQGSAAGVVAAETGVGNHISTIFAKLQVATRAEAVVRGRDAGLGRG
jgi:DNA-binding NarL/FixJ family response regulator